MASPDAIRRYRGMPTSVLLQLRIEHEDRAARCDDPADIVAIRHLDLAEQISQEIKLRQAE